MDALEKSQNIYNSFKNSFFNFVSTPALIVLKPFISQGLTVVTTNVLSTLFLQAVLGLYSCHSEIYPVFFIYRINSLNLCEKELNQVFIEAGSSIFCYILINGIRGDNQYATVQFSYIHDTMSLQSRCSVTAKQVQCYCKAYAAPLQRICNTTAKNMQ